MALFQGRGERRGRSLNGPGCQMRAGAGRKRADLLPSAPISARQLSEFLYEPPIELCKYEHNCLGTRKMTPGRG
jgi:hypothetical protein